MSGTLLETVRTCGLTRARLEENGFPVKVQNLGVSSRQGGRGGILLPGLRSSGRANANDLSNIKRRYGVLIEYMMSDMGRQRHREGAADRSEF